jgi:hypothetical protein
MHQERFHEIGQLYFRHLCQMMLDDAALMSINEQDQGMRFLISFSVNPLG